MTQSLHCLEKKVIHCRCIDPGGSQMVERLLGFGQAWAFPAAGRLACKGGNRLDRLPDGRRLFLYAMHGSLNKAVADEVPSGVTVQEIWSGGQISLLASLMEYFGGASVNHRVTAPFTRVPVRNAERADRDAEHA